MRGNLAVGKWIPVVWDDNHLQRNKGEIASLVAPLLPHNDSLFVPGDVGNPSLGTGRL